MTVLQLQGPQAILVGVRHTLPKVPSMFLTGRKRHQNGESYTERFSVSSWYEFVPYRECWGCSVWIEIDRDQVGPKVISGSDLIARWESEKAHQHSIMPHIEAAHLGPLPRTAFKRAFLVREGDSQFRPLAC